MLAAHNPLPLVLGLEKPHVKRILLASLLSIVVHAIAGQWIWHPSMQKLSVSLPRPLEVVFAIPQPIPPSVPEKIVQAVQKQPRSIVATNSRPSPALTLPQTDARPSSVASTSDAAPSPAAPEPTISAAEPTSTVPVFDAAYLQNPKPAYPLSAKRRGMEGNVLLRAEVKPDGLCGRVELKKSSGWDALDQAALQAVQGWHFAPARRGDQAVTAWVEIPISFRLGS